MNLLHWRVRSLARGKQGGCAALIEGMMSGLVARGRFLELIMSRLTAPTLLDADDVNAMAGA